MKKVILLIYILMTPLLCSAQQWKFFGSYGVLHDVTWLYKANAANFKLTMGAQTPQDCFILATSFEVCFYNWQANSRITADNWRWGFYGGVNPLAFFVKNSFVNPYIIFDGGGTILYNINDPTMYYGGGLRVELGSDIMKFYIQDIIGTDYRLKSKTALNGNKLEIGVSFAIPIN